MAIIKEKEGLPDNGCWEEARDGDRCEFSEVLSLTETEISTGRSGYGQEISLHLVSALNIVKCDYRRLCCLLYL